MSRLVRQVLALGVLAAALSAWASPAEANAELVSSEPAAGAAVAPPSRVVLRFAGRVEPAGSHLWIEDAAGTEAQPLAVPRHLDGDDRTLVVEVPRVIGGDYRLGWHTVAADGDPLQGSIPFTVVTHAVPAGSPAPAATPVPAAAPAPTAAPAPAPTRAPPVPAPGHGHANGIAAGVARIGVDVALAVFLGGLAFVTVVWPQAASFATTRRVLWTGALTATAGCFALAALQHATAEGIPSLAAFTPGHLAGTLEYRFGRVALVRIGLLAGLAVATHRLVHGGQRVATSRWWRGITGALGTGLVATGVLLGHDGGLTGADGAARVVHGVGVSVWVGGLLMLFALVLRRRGDDAAGALIRFSRLATVAVTALLAAGIVLAVDLIGAAGALPTTPYGRFLLLKLAAVSGLLVAAHRNRSHVRLRLQVAGPAAISPVVRLVGVELGLLVGVFALTALLVSQRPPA